jgi:metal-dependent amidase/aminoacylase/carboxypeptidase family protein
MPEDKLPDVKVTESTPVTVNDTPLARRLNAALTEKMGAGVVIPFRQTNMGAEDFAYFVAPEHNIPGYYFAVGGTKPEWIAAAKAGGPPVSGHHSPLFKIDPEPAIRTGAEAMTLATLELLKR